MEKIDHRSVTNILTVFPFCAQILLVFLKIYRICSLKLKIRLYHRKIYEKFKAEFGASTTQNNESIYCYRRETYTITYDKYIERHIVQHYTVKKRIKKIIIDRVTRIKSKLCLGKLIPTSHYTIYLNIIISSKFDNEYQEIIALVY